MPFMQYLERISEIERRAEEINLTLGEVCRRAEVPVSTIWRWRKGKVSPIQASLELHLGRLERQLDAEQSRIMRAA